MEESSKKASTVSVFLSPAGKPGGKASGAEEAVSQPASLSTSSRWGCPGAELKGEKQPEVISGRAWKQLSTSVLAGVCLGLRGGAGSTGPRGEEAAVSRGREPQKIIFYLKYS